MNKQTAKKKKNTKISNWLHADGINCRLTHNFYDDCELCVKCVVRTAGDELRWVESDGGGG